MKKKSIINFTFIILLILVVSVRIYYIHQLNVQNGYSTVKMHNNGDASHYLQIAKNIANFNVFSDNNSIVASESASWRAPFWPFILSFIFYISENLLILIILKSILELVLFLSALYFFKRIFNYDLLFILPFLLLLIEPQYLKYSITFLSESLTSILILILTIVFITLNKIKSFNVLVPLLCGIIVLTHPVSIFFITTVFCLYILLNFKVNLKKTIFHGILFIAIIFSWMTRNYLIFDKGFYLTASQGATFSKGWNEKVAYQFNNVDGDLADEGLNLKYLNPKLIANSDKGVLATSKLYKLGTISYIKSLTFNQKVKIIFLKLKSNFNPFPEKSKAGFLESTSIFFRMFYSFLFLQMIFHFYKKGIHYKTTCDKIYLIVLSIILGQSAMAILIYTGLRFNSIYSLSLLFCLIYVNLDFFKKYYVKSFGICRLDNQL